MRDSAGPERQKPDSAPQPEEGASEGSYFRIPERIGLVTPAPDKPQPEGEAEESEPKPVTFGRRPRANRRRGR
jgi:hypothetical protein